MLALVPWPVLSSPDQDTGPALRAVTAAHRRLDAVMPARDLAGGVVAHVEVARRMLGHDPGAGVAAALSEAAGFAGWLHADMCDRGTARGFYRLAIGAARRAGHDLLAGYMLGSLAMFEIDNGDPVTGLRLASRAQEQLGNPLHPTPRAWLAALHALGHAAGGDGPAADAALCRAEAAVDARVPRTPRRGRLSPSPPNSSYRAGLLRYRRQALAASPVAWRGAARAEAARGDHAGGGHRRPPGSRRVHRAMRRSGWPPRRWRPGSGTARNG